jgi:hypothetical protein
MPLGNASAAGRMTPTRITTPRPKQAKTTGHEGAVTDPGSNKRNPQMQDALEEIEREAKRTNKKVKIMDKGSVEEQAALIIRAMLAGCSLFQRPPYGAHLINPEEPDTVFIIQRPVMEYLTDDVLELNQEH